MDPKVGASGVGPSHERRIEFVLSFIFSLFAYIHWTIDPIYTLGVRASRCDAKICCIIIIICRRPYAALFLIKKNSEPIKENEKSNDNVVHENNSATVTLCGYMRIHIGKINLRFLLFTVFFLELEFGEFRHFVFSNFSISIE